MWHTVQRLSLGIVLILLASGVLLFSEPERPGHRGSNSPGEPAAHRKAVRVAMFQIASQPIIDEGAAGVISSLNDAGYIEGQSLKLTRFNAEGDLATGNAIAQELVGGDYDLVITLTTAALQSVANANKQRKVPHVFGLVSDPIKAGVGIGDEPFDHPSHLVGIGTLPPVDLALEMARQLNPKLSRVGLAWNPAEINSEVCTRLARDSCQKLKIELLEANVENTAAVKESVASLIDRQAEALLVGSDVTMLAAIEVVVKVARDAHRPVFTCLPGNAMKGTLFDVGANYAEVGRMVGRVAGRVLQGEDISKIPVEMALPPKTFLNATALKNLAGQWVFPSELVNAADSWIDEEGLHEKSAKPDSSIAKSIPGQSPGKCWEARLVAYVNSPDVEEAEHGFRDGLKGSGLVDGRDYVLKSANAQGDMTTLNGLVDAAIGDRADILLTISTQALQSSVQRARGTPIVFTMVANPFLAGMGKTETDHLPNVTGAYGTNDVGKMMPILRRLMPKARRIGALYAPTEVNSVYSYELLAAAAKTEGYEFLSLGINSPSEAPDAAQSLCDQRIDLFCLPNSNLATSSYPTIAQAAARSRVPVFGFLGSMTSQGAVAVLTRDYYDMGVESGRIAGRVMRGEKPGEIPFHQCTKSKLFVNPTAAKSCGVALPDGFLESADKVIGK